MHLFDSVGLNEVLVCRNGCTSVCQAKCAVYIWSKNNRAVLHAWAVCVISTVG